MTTIKDLLEEQTKLDEEVKESCIKRDRCYEEYLLIKKEVGKLNDTKSYTQKCIYKKIEEINKTLRQHNNLSPFGICLSVSLDFKQVYINWDSTIPIEDIDRFIQELNRVKELLTKEEE